MGLSCALVTPVVYLSLILLDNVDLHPGERAAVTMALTAFASAIVGVCFSAMSLRREAENDHGTAGMAAVGLVISGLSVCFNCYALGNA